MRQFLSRSWRGSQCHGHAECESFHNVIAFRPVSKLFWVALLQLHDGTQLPKPSRLAGIKDWRFNEQSEDIEWLLRFSSQDGVNKTASWQILYTITEQHQWIELQRFLLPKLHQLRGYCTSHCIQKPGVEAVQLFHPSPHAFQPWRRDYIVDWRYSKTKEQVCLHTRQAQKQHG